MLRGAKAGMVSAVMGWFSKVEMGGGWLGNWGAEEEEGDSLTTEITEDTEGRCGEWNVAGLTSEMGTTYRSAEICSAESRTYAPECSW